MITHNQCTSSKIRVSKLTAPHDAIAVTPVDKRRSQVSGRHNIEDWALLKICIVSLEI